MRRVHTGVLLVALALVAAGCSSEPTSPAEPEAPAVQQSVIRNCKGRSPKKAASIPCSIPGPNDTEPWIPGDAPGLPGELP